MATWQFDCVLVPAAGWVQGIAPSDIVRDGSSVCWKGYSPRDIRIALGALGEPSETWDVNTVIWGKEDETCVNLSVAGAFIEELRLRLDMRNARNDLLMRLLDVARNKELVVVTENGDAIEPLVDDLLHVAARSPAASFVRDPEAFLRGLAANKKT